MEWTVHHLAEVLGASGIEDAGHDARFVVVDRQGARLKVAIEALQQRVMLVLVDGAGVTRCTLDLAPVGRVVEDRAAPGRVTLEVGSLRAHIDSQPTLGVELTTV